MFLVPPRPRPLIEVLAAIAGADLILLGPGSLYTSVLPNILIPEIARAIAKSRATRVYIANLMTQPGETPGYSAADHIRAIHRHAHRRLIDWVIMNRKPVSPGVARRYRAKGAEPVLWDLAELQRLGVRVRPARRARRNPAQFGTPDALVVGRVRHASSHALKFPAVRGESLPSGKLRFRTIRLHVS